MPGAEKYRKEFSKVPMFGPGGVAYELDLTRFLPEGEWPADSCLVTVDLATQYAWAMVPFILDDDDDDDDEEQDDDPDPAEEPPAPVYSWRDVVYPGDQDVRVLHRQFFQATAADGTTGWVDKGDLTGFDAAAFEMPAHNPANGLPVPKAWENPPCLASVDGEQRLYAKSGSNMVHSGTIYSGTCITELSDPFGGDFTPLQSAVNLPQIGWSKSSWGGETMCFLRVDDTVAYIDASVLQWKTDDREEC
jgi:hypothetical protein